MVKAKLINNQLCCPACESKLGSIKDYFLVKVDGQTYVQFIRKCSNAKCKEESSYLKNMEIGDNTKYIIDFNKIERIKENE